ncbi:hypothetical protein Ngar_c05150 [Candidatus Nitrososphaera gargensis Ga9.2]|uniref:Uncharacterized protein n=1 Tax=Nitrososphaera gargensis (strain Ga9.2) TaxID=1237085 RepID=K0IF66_NITGG|nr:hypothetical protein [Candidatus Nitrososphaera gargensis]AFU57458.1 hypothetical protein Ngar_c05150 [Candidatus Nitrososphaera gargensis Ga9.2]
MIRSTGIEEREGNKIFDLVIYNRESKRAIMIECKSSIGDARKSVLTPLADQIKNVQDYKKELEDEIGGEIADIEYVICGLSQDIEEVGKALQDNNEPVCLWTVDLFRFTLKLFNLTGSADGEQTGKLIRKGQLHRDEKLRKSLFEKTESRGQIEGFKIAPTSHICRMLSRVFERIIQEVILTNTRQEKRFWLHELVQMTQKELPKLQAEDVQRITKELYELALQLKIIEVEKSLDKENDMAFILKIGARSARTLEKEINERYAEEKCRDRSPALALKEFEEFLKSNIGSLDYHLSRAAAEQEPSKAPDDNKAK